MSKWLPVSLALFASAAVLAHAASREAFDSHTVETVMAPMRDGVKLATDVYLPARGGKPAAGRFPVLIERTPYNKNARRTMCAFLARRGYAVVLQDCRGRYGSEGDFYPFLNEGKDGYDTIEWAAAQPWSNGNVGTFGGSYTGMDQYHAAMYRPPHLVGMFVQMAGANLFQEVGYPGGVLSAGWLSWILRSAATSRQAGEKRDAIQALEALLKKDFAGWFRQPHGARAEVLREFPAHLKLLQDTDNHPQFDGYWKQRGFYTGGYYGEIKDVPILFVSGWYDNFLEGLLDNFSALSRMQKTPKKLIVGPWPHGMGTPECGGAFFGNDRTTEDQGALVAEWFDSLLRSAPFELIDSAPVQIFRMGGGGGERTSRGKLYHGGEWRTATAWPPPDVRATRFYIHEDGVLGPARPGDEQPSRFEFDPLAPVPTLGGRYNVPGAPGCAQDSQRLNRRPDVLSYSSAPLAAALELTGKIRATLWVSSGAPDTDFTAKLMDVYPNGYALNVVDGQIRARYRNGYEKAEMMKPGSVYEVTIDLGSTSNLFAVGHRIRLDISSSNFPKLEIAQAKTSNTVYHDRRRPSYIELPVAQGH